MDQKMNEMHEGKIADALVQHAYNSYAKAHGLDRAFLQVRAFHKAFGHPFKDSPTMLEPERVTPRAKWMREEIQEFEDAETIVDQADAMIDLIYFALGTLVEMGVMPQSLMDIVHYDGNMSKMHTDEDGQMFVRMNEDGKVVKPEGWVAPEPLLEAEIALQQELRPLSLPAA
jgi:predicted HAD superfamily Cof-like phosphohydrolase